MATIESRAHRPRKMLILWLGLIALCLSATVALSDVSAQTTAKPAAKGKAAQGKKVQVAKSAAITPEMKYNLDAINLFRAGLKDPKVRPLALDIDLSNFAFAGSQELMSDHIFHKHFTDAGQLLFTIYGFRIFAGENQGPSFGQPRAASVNVQIDQILKAMIAEGPNGGHYQNMANPIFTRVGIGLVVDGNGALYLTNDFSG
jgi:uncharacterized protein YkwD